MLKCSVPLSFLNMDVEINCILLQSSPADECNRPTTVTARVREARSGFAKLHWAVPKNLHWRAGAEDIQSLQTPLRGSWPEWRVDCSQCFYPQDVSNMLKLDTRFIVNIHPTTLRTHNHQLDVLCCSITNLKYWGNSEKIISRTLQLLNDLSVGYSSVRKLVKIDTVQFVLTNHTVSPLIEFLLVHDILKGLWKNWTVWGLSTHSLSLTGLWHGQKWLHLFVDSEAYHEQIGPIPNSNETLDIALSNAHT